MEIATVRPELGGLFLVIQTAQLLSGEKADAQAPLPYMRLCAYAKSRGLSNAFAGLVLAYDSAVTRGVVKRGNQDTGIPKGLPKARTG